MTLFNMRSLGVGGLYVTCQHCGDETAVNGRFLAGGRPGAVVRPGMGCSRLSNPNGFVCLAVTTSKRSSFNPEWKTLRGEGAADINASNWVGIFVPTNVPQLIIEKRMMSFKGS